MNGRWEPGGVKGVSNPRYWFLTPLEVLLTPFVDGDPNPRNFEDGRVLMADCCAMLGAAMFWV
jgi:hypothetical protein